MSLTKRFLKTKPICKVNFKLTKAVVGSAKKVELLGDFNEWEKGALSMKRNKDGSFVATLDLETGKDYQFRYLIDGETWVNDWDADRYQFNPAGNCENSVVSLT